MSQPVDARSRTTPRRPGSGDSEMPTRRMSAPILILNGPNLNTLGQRQPEIYGRETLADVEARCREHASAAGVALEFRQSNLEGELIGWIQEARGRVRGLVLNAGALTHTSVGILDALLLLDCPVIEVHLSNIHRRESFRHHSYVAGAATGMICGLGAYGYLAAIDAVLALTAPETPGTA